MKQYKYIDKKFEKEKEKRILNYSKNLKIKKLFKVYNTEIDLAKYSYNFSWLGIPIIQYPGDMIVMQELIYQLNPDLIIECGIARGGSLVYYASLLKLLGKKKSKVLGIDIDVRKHTQMVLKNHSVKNKIKFIQGSSTSKTTFDKAKLISKNYKKRLVILDSNHTHKHVLDELNFYSRLVSKNSYLVVFDTTINIYDKKKIKLLKKNYPFKEWGKNNNPMTATHEFLKKNKNFKIDKRLNYKAFCTSTFNGYLLKS